MAGADRWQSIFPVGCSAGFPCLWASSAMKMPPDSSFGIPSNRKNALVNRGVDKVSDTGRVPNMGGAVRSRQCVINNISNTLIGRAPLAGGGLVLPVGHISDLVGSPRNTSAG